MFGMVAEVMVSRMGGLVLRLGPRSQVCQKMIYARRVVGLVAPLHTYDDVACPRRCGCEPRRLIAGARMVTANMDEPDTRPAKSAASSPTLPATASGALARVFR